MEIKTEQIKAEIQRRADAIGRFFSSLLTPITALARAEKSKSWTTEYLTAVLLECPICHEWLTTATPLGKCNQGWINVNHSPYIDPLPRNLTARQWDVLSPGLQALLRDGRKVDRNPPCPNAGKSWRVKTPRVVSVETLAT